MVSECKSAFKLCDAAGGERHLDGTTGTESDFNIAKPRQRLARASQFPSEQRQMKETLFTNPILVCAIPKLITWCRDQVQGADAWRTMRDTALGQQPCMDYRMAQ